MPSHDLTNSKKLACLSALLLAGLAPTACVVEDDPVDEIDQEGSVQEVGRATLPELGEDHRSSLEGAPVAAATGWTWTYSAFVGSETYRLLKNGQLRGSSTAQSNITIRDHAADGLGQRVYWKVDSSSTWRICNHEGGNGTQSTCNVTNDKFIQYQFCMKNGNTIVACAPGDGFRS